MTARFRKKRKGRGAGTGYGAKKKHRGGGSRGGRGLAGMHKHKWSLVVSKMPEHYGYKGFFSRKKKIKAINVGDAGELAGGRNEIDLTALGYGKLLSGGKIETPLTIRVGKATGRALAKVERAGGKVIVRDAGEETKRQEA